MRNFTQGNIFRHLVGFSGPIILGSVLQSCYMIVDAFWVGRLLGKDALAAVSTSFPLLFLVFSFMIGLGIATNILVGQSYGAGNTKVLSSVLTNSLVMLLASCGLLSLVSVLLSGQLLALINTPETIHHQAHRYLVIMLLGMVIRAVYNWFSGVLKGLGDSKTPLKLLCLSVAFNIILTPLLIKGVGFFPELGVAGSAWGSVVSSCLAVGFGYIYLIQKNHLLNIKRWTFSLDRRVLQKIIRLGFPSSLQMVVRSIGWIVLMAIVNRFGSATTAAYGIGVRIDMFAFLPAMSIGFAVSSMVAQNAGASHPKRIRTILIWSTLYALCLTVLCFCIVQLTSRTLVSFFTQDTDVIVKTQTYLRIVSFSYLVFASLFSLQGVIRGIGHTGILLFLTVISMLGVRIPLAFFLSSADSLQERGIWVAILVSALVSLILHGLYYRYSLTSINMCHNTDISNLM